MEQFNLIVVDAGASKKIDELAKQLFLNNYKFNIVQCHKQRNIQTGKIEKLEVYSEDLKNLPCIIVDDIADGAASFIYCVKELQNIKNYKNSFLVVSHGIFSKGFKELNQYFDGIYCTNSYSDLNSPEMSLKYDNTLHKVKQLNVF
jgi:ribose-phosphate pyrophosphokinase